MNIDLNFLLADITSSPGAAEKSVEADGDSEGFAISFAKLGAQNPQANSPSNVDSAPGMPAGSKPHPETIINMPLPEPVSTAELRAMSIQFSVAGESGSNTALAGHIFENTQHTVTAMDTPISSVQNRNEINLTPAEIPNIQSLEGVSLSTKDIRVPTPFSPKISGLPTNTNLPAEITGIVPATMTEVMTETSEAPEDMIAGDFNAASVEITLKPMEIHIAGKVDASNTVTALAADLNPTLSANEAQIQTAIPPLENSPNAISLEAALNPQPTDQLASVAAKVSERHLNGLQSETPPIPGVASTQAAIGDSLVRPSTGQDSQQSLPHSAAQTPKHANLDIKADMLEQTSPLNEGVAKHGVNRTHLDGGDSAKVADGETSTPRQMPAAAADFEINLKTEYVTNTQVSDTNSASRAANDSKPLPIPAETRNALQPPHNALDKTAPDIQLNQASILSVDQNAKDHTRPETGERIPHELRARAATQDVEITAVKPQSNERAAVLQPQSIAAPLESPSQQPPSVPNVSVAIAPLSSTHHEYTTSQPINAPLPINPDTSPEAIQAKVKIPDPATVKQDVMLSSAASSEMPKTTPESGFIAPASVVVTQTDSTARAPAIMNATSVQAMHLSTQPALQAVADNIIKAHMSQTGVTVRLDPPEMGNVTINFQFDGADRSVTAIIRADIPETAALLRDRADILHQALKDSGFGTIDLSFEQNEQHTQNPFEFEDMQSSSQLFAIDHAANDGAPINIPSLGRALGDGMQIDLKL